MRALGDPRVLTCRTLLRGALGAGLTTTAATFLPGCGSRGDEPVSAGASREGPPETPTIRLGKSVIACYAAQALASGYLREEGFTDVQYFDVRLEQSFPALAQGAIDMHMYPAPLAAWRVDAGDPIVMLSGVQVGCFYVLASDAVRSMSDLKGRTVATAGPGAPDHVVLGALLANVGINIRKDVSVVTGRPTETPARTGASTRRIHRHQAGPAGPAQGGRRRRRRSRARCPGPGRRRLHHPGPVRGNPR